MTLTAPETRVLGCLLEKERLTPEQYPLSLNALVNACNQTTNREPVVSYDEKTVERALDGLREKKLAALIWTAGSRVQKFRHNLPEHYELEPADVAVLCVLMLRGPQTPGELRTRTERMHAFAGIVDLEACLTGLMAGAEPLVKLLPQRPGQKESRYVQLLSPVEEQETAPACPSPARLPEPSRLETLEDEVRELREEVFRLKEELAAFRKQFE